MLTLLVKGRAERGDTLIEVLFAITVFSLIVVSALGLMNQGSATSQRSLEITLVRQQIDSQAETLRFLHESYVSNYQSGQTYNLADASTSPAEEYYKIIQYVKANGKESASQFGATKCQVPPANASAPFILDTHAAQFVTTAVLFKTAATHAQTTYDVNTGALTGSEGLWIEAVRSPNVAGSNAGYIDFHIRACWDAPGLGIPMNLGTIVRLYEPRG